MKIEKSLNEKIRRNAKKIYMINKLGGCCEYCGENRFYVLHFHHTKDDKESCVGVLKGGRLSNFENEANKCILLCANCHAKHHTGLQNIKLTRHTSKLTIFNYMGTSACSCCGESDSRILNFHHMRDKEFLITNKINNTMYRTIEDIPQDIKDEVDKCILLCPNCHISEHHDHKFFEDYMEQIIDKISNLKEIQPKLDKELVKEMFLSGVKQIEIARHFSASKGTICDILKTFGLTTKLEDKKINKNKVMELNKQGKTNKEIIDELGCSKTSVSLILTTNELEFNKQDNPDKNKHLRKFDPTPEELYELLKNNSYADLGKLYGVSRIAVFKRKQKFDKMKDK